MDIKDDKYRETEYRASVAINSAVAIAGLTVALLTGHGLADFAPHFSAAPKAEQLAPDAARIAIANGMLCTLESAGPEVGSHVDIDNTEVTDVQLHLSFSESDDSKAARKKYKHSAQVIWHPENIGSTPFTTVDSMPIQMGETRHTIISGEWTQSNVEVTVPSDNFKAGDTIVVSREGDAETGYGGPQSGLLETVTEQVCGAFKLLDGRIVVIKLPERRSSSHTYAGKEATPFVTVP